MTQAHTEWHWLDARETVTLAELAHCCGLSESEIDELVDYCALKPLATAASGSEVRTFSAHWVVPLRNANKMRRDFDLDLFTMAILLGQLYQIETLQRQMRALQALLPPALRASMDLP